MYTVAPLSNGHSIVVTPPAKSSLITTSVQIGQFLNYLALWAFTPFYQLSVPFLYAQYTAIRPGEFGNYQSYYLEIIRRIFSTFFPLAALSVAAPTALLGGAIDFAGNYIKQNPYYYVRGKAAEKLPTSEHTFFSLNACMFWGGLPLVFGGVRIAKERIEELVALLFRQDADIVALQEVSFDAGLLLIDKLKDRYAHFYTQIGPNPWRLESGLFIASKYPVLSQGYLPFPGQSGVRRGAFYIETPSFNFFTAHLHPSEYKQDQDIRNSQLTLITKKIQDLKKNTGKPSFLMGDLNIQKTGEQGDDYSSSHIDVDYYDPFHDKTLTETTATCTNYFNYYTKGKPIPTETAARCEIDDYGLLKIESKNLFTFNVELIHTYDTNHPEKALSDHRGLLMRAKQC